MSIYGRASTVTDPRETLVGGIGDTEGSGAGTSGQGGARLGVTGQGKVGSGESGPGVGAEGALPICGIFDTRSILVGFIQQV